MYFKILERSSIMIFKHQERSIAQYRNNKMKLAKPLACTFDPGKGFAKRLTPFFSLWNGFLIKMNNEWMNEVTNQMRDSLKMVFFFNVLFLLLKFRQKTWFFFSICFLFVFFFIIIIINSYLTGNKRDPLCDRISISSANLSEHIYLFSPSTISIC